jgi:hypothetical protein
MGGFFIDCIHREEPQACPALSTMHDTSMIDLLINNFKSLKPMEK